MKLRTFKATDAEYERWRDQAYAQRLTFSAWARNVLNGVEMSKPKPPTTATATATATKVVSKKEHVRPRMTVTPTDPRSLIAESLAAYLTPEQVAHLIDEVLSITKKVTGTFECSNCGHVGRDTIAIPDAKSVVSALTDLLAQGFGRPGEAKIDDSQIVFKRLVVSRELEEAETH